MYAVDLKPMHKQHGYVVVAATPILFEAAIETIIVPKTIYQVTVTFGNKKIFFDPKDGRSINSRTIEGVAAVLDARPDIADKEQVIAAFRKQALSLVRNMETDGYIYVQPKKIGSK
uniref:hypothetical protein n=1 Tax=Alistipes sp. D31t1_170403_E11 TaxID=2787128 RepID=UPI001E413687|nr:hypothetical protein [Alistipes sp. D31t1_170403_E11]